MCQKSKVKLFFIKTFVIASTSSIYTVLFPLQILIDNTLNSCILRKSILNHGAVTRINMKLN